MGCFVVKNRIKSYKRGLKNESWNYGNRDKNPNN